MPDTDARLARLYDSLKAPAAGSRAPLGPYGFWGIAGSIWPYLTLSERLFRSAPVGPSRRHAVLCAASQCGDQLEFGGLFDRDVAGIRVFENLVYERAARPRVSGKIHPAPSVRRSPGIPGRQSRQASPFSADAATGFTPSKFTCIDAGLLCLLFGGAGIAAPARPRCHATAAPPITPRNSRGFTLLPRRRATLSGAIFILAGGQPGKCPAQ
jgi:hypothetical protein